MAVHDGAELGPPVAQELLPTVACCLIDCPTTGDGRPFLTEDGQPRVAPPPSWGEIEVSGDSDHVAVRFTCSAGCERRALLFPELIQL